MSQYTHLTRINSCKFSYSIYRRIFNRIYFIFKSTYVREYIILSIINKQLFIY